MYYLCAERCQNWPILVCTQMCLIFTASLSTFFAEKKHHYSESYYYLLISGRNLGLCLNVGEEKCILHKMNAKDTRMRFPILADSVTPVFYQPLPRQELHSFGKITWQDPLKHTFKSSSHFSREIKAEI